MAKGWKNQRVHRCTGPVLFRGQLPEYFIHCLPENHSCLRDGHTIATTSRRPLTTTIFGVVAGRLSEVGKCLSMIGDWLSENYIDNLSPTSDNHPFSGWFSMVGKWLLMIAEQFWSARGFRCSINNHRQPNKAAIQNEYTFDPEKCR